MKRGKSRKKPSTAHHAKKSGPVTDRSLIPVNDAPLRKRATTEFNRAMAKLEKARAELRGFEQEDRPSFGGWMAATFGALMTEIRETARLIHEKESLIEEVELELMWGRHRTYATAYVVVMKRRENPEPEENFEEAEGKRRSQNGAASGNHDDPHARNTRRDDSEGFDPFESRDSNHSTEALHEMFEDFLETVFGISPKQMKREEYERMFAQFEAQILGRDSRGNSFPRDEEEGRSPGREEARIKEVYRALVRRLHPDLRADDDAEVSAIWHEVQEAYAARNLARLETLLALTEMQGGGSGGQATLFQMRGALEELKHGLRAIQRSIRGAKRDPAWGFSQNENRTPMQKRIQIEMEEEMFQQQRLLASLERMLEQWSRPEKVRDKKTRKQPTASGKAKAQSPIPSEIPLPESDQGELFTF